MLLATAVVEAEAAEEVVELAVGVMVTVTTTGEGQAVAETVIKASVIENIQKKRAYHPWR